MAAKIWLRLLLLVGVCFTRLAAFPHEFHCMFHFSLEAFGKGASFYYLEGVMIMCLKLLSLNPKPGLSY